MFLLCLPKELLLQVSQRVTGTHLVYTIVRTNHIGDFLFVTPLRWIVSEYKVAPFGMHW